MSSHDLKRSIEAHKRWLGYLQPDGLVVSAAALVDKGHYYQEAQRERQIEFIDHLLAFQNYDEEEGTVEVTDFKALATDFLRLPEREWVDASDLGEIYQIQLNESPEVLAPSAALRWPRSKELAEGEPAYQLLIKFYDGDLDAAYETATNTWSTSATRRFERLLRETGIPIGILVSRTQLRLVSAPVGENAGHLTFRFADMVSTMGRPILGAFDLLFNAGMLFLGEQSHQLPALLRQSREMQANVSIELARQVLDGLYDLVRGTQAADARTDGRLLRHLLATNPNLIYEGQLNVLMRLVFLLFAEDRSLMPNSTLYNGHYSIHALYERLRQDHALHQDTMDARYGAWARLLALFRLVFHGHRHKDLSLPPRYGYLFDPERFPFLEGRATDPETRTEENLDIPLIPDGTIYRLLQRLLFLNGERISYRTLDVEQIGSVYETMMGFGLTRPEGRTIAIRPQKSHGAPVNLDLDHLLALKPADRHKIFTDETGRKLTGTRLADFGNAATVEEILAVLQGPTATFNLVAVNATPHLAQPGSLLLQPTDARRKSGSHYTPRKLTEPIVKKALEPVLANLGEKPFPAQILDLKVCDPAVGSGAFLVEACRQLGDELVKAWAAHGGKPVIPPDEDEVLHARRLVAQRCLYGVDRNPMAADLAKLSLWLATLAKDHPFTFLDHSIRSGDSLVGLSKKQILAFHWDLTHISAKQTIFGQDVLEKKIKSALAYRQEILNAGDYVLPEMKAAQLHLAEQEIDKVRRAGDLAVLGFFSGSKPKERQEARDILLERWLDATSQTSSEESLSKGIALKREIRQARENEKPVAPFHWEIEFPEVFERKDPGFDAFVGNPPFVGGTMISTSNGLSHKDWLYISTPKSGNRMDLVAYFFRRAFTLIRSSGTLGLIATNSIAQGDTRKGGLGFLCAHGGTIYSARRRVSWPGEAAVVVSVVHLCRGDFPAAKKLDDRTVNTITAYLFHAGTSNEPHALNQNRRRAFEGAKPYGQGFLFDDGDPKSTALSEMRRLVERSEHNRALVFPFLSGVEVNRSPMHAADRFIINFGERELNECKQWPELLDIVEKKVKPERDSKPKEIRTQPWWQFFRTRPELVSALSTREHVIVHSLVSAHLSFARVPSRTVFSHALGVFAFEQLSAFGILQSRIHEVWVRFFASSLEDRLRYVLSDCFETFPFTETWESDAHLEAIGLEYYDYRADLMVRNDEGLTKTYNRFHDPGETSPEIHKLRELHAVMDRAVIDAYGWDIKDEDLVCEFIPDFTEEDDDGNEIPKNIRFRWRDEVRDDILARLLALNAERHAAEINAGLHAKGTTKPKAAKKPPKVRVLPKEQELDLVAISNLPEWAARVPSFTYPLSSLPRTNAQNGLAYYRAVIPALIQEAGGALPLNILFDAISRLEDKDLLLGASVKAPETTKKKWAKSFAELIDANAFASALESLCQVAQDVRLVGSRGNLQVRLVRETPIMLDWYLLDAQLILASEAAAFQKSELTRQVPAELIDKISQFAAAS